jgi:hypothetical protein
MTRLSPASLVVLCATLAPGAALAAPANPLVPPPVEAPALPTGAVPAKTPPATASPAAGPAKVSAPTGRAPVVTPKPSPFIPLEQQTGPAGAARVTEARDHFARGLQHFKEGGLEAALAEFLRAYELAPSYRLHFNIAQVHYELRNYVEAKRSFQRYLAEADAELPPDRRALVEGELSKLDRLVAQFSVKTSVPGVQIAVDGVPAGLVAQGNLVLVNTNPGVRRVSAARSGFLPASLVVTVVPGERRKLVFELAPVAQVSAPLAPPTPSALAPGADLTAYAAPPDPRLKLWISVASAVTLAAASGVFALVTRNAHEEFDHQLSRVPNERQNVDDARSRMSRYALIADTLAGATAVATGVSIYFVLTADSGHERQLATAGWQGKF